MIIPEAAGFGPDTRRPGTGVLEAQVRPARLVPPALAGGLR